MEEGKKKLSDKFEAEMNYDFNAVVEELKQKKGNLTKLAAATFETKNGQIEAAYSKLLS